MRDWPKLCTRFASGAGTFLMAGLATVGAITLTAAQRPRVAVTVEQAPAVEHCPVAAPEGPPAPTVQPFLVRGNYLEDPRALLRANAYRRRHYSPTVATTFMGLPVELHPVAATALACVERLIVERCPDAYTPRALSGYRSRPSYRGEEISNHNFGIALDIDPQRNPCCGCSGDWSSSPRCTAGEVLGHYDLPQCWIDAFTDHGWYWLGHDRQLGDSMHFEYLGKPELAGCDP